MALILLAVGAVGYFWGQRATPEPEVPERVVEVRPTPSVITALHKLARLEGAQLHLERVIDLKEKQSRFFGLVEAEDAILLVAAGDVTAGVDLSKLRAQDIQVDEARKSVSIVLPRAEIFSTRVDNERTYVHTRATDTLAEEHAQLESKARLEAERGFDAAARESGLLDTAEKSVARSVQALVQSLGFDQVEVTFSGGVGLEP